MSEQRPLTAREFVLERVEMELLLWRKSDWQPVTAEDVAELCEAYHRAALSAESAELRKRMQAGLEAHRDFSEGNGGRE